MKQTEEEHQEIIDRLREMPEMKDETDKQVLYNRISSSVSNKEQVKSRNQKHKLVPVLATIMTAALIFIIPFIMNQREQLDLSTESGTELATNSDEAEYSRMMESSDFEQDIEESEEQDINSMNELTITPEGELQSYVIQESNEPYKVVYGALSDPQQQFIIPISFIIDETADLEEYYNNLENYMNREDWITNDYMLKNASFELKESVVLVDLENGFDIGEGSANAYIFEKVLVAMFTPYGISKAVFESDSNGIDLGPYGFVEELPLKREEEEIYKLYNNQLLIPLPNTNNLSIGDAITEMKAEEEEFNLGRTIPEDIHFSIDSTGDQLILTLDEESNFGNGQEELTMIEAILMTAKSFEYKFVQFNDLPYNQIGTYDTSEPIQVPEAVNPVDIRN
ncbi:hypothetical protein [Oceanobacillus saliphilus]|uniref:hypothetical protein n=1 Tax=Oceanobacillus saliphilus TaxID=2925834 RepID=UPI00201E2CCF|nr:hypothetical protein [Oceanobacillus saliphilus]